MLNISDGRDQRKAIIAKIAEVNLAAGVILAGADWEWTLHRSILVLGKSPTVELRDKLLCPQNSGNSNDIVKRLWRDEIKDLALTTLFDSWAKQNVNSSITWNDISTAQKYRNQLVHSVRSNVDDDTAKIVIYIFEMASDILCDFANQKGKNLFSRLKPRPRKGDTVRNGNKTGEKIQKLNTSLKKLVAKYGKTVVQN